MLYSSIRSQQRSQLGQHSGRNPALSCRGPTSRALPTAHALTSQPKRSERGWQMFPVRTSCNINAVAKIAVAVVLLLTGALPLAQPGARVGSSLLLLIDTSGSMGDQVGDGNPQAKIEAAKHAGIAALGRAARTGSIEVAVLAFSGDCANPVPRYQDFTSDVDRLTAFIDSLQPGGGTPMADALLFANRFMDRNGHAGAKDRMIMLLADGQNDCGDVSQAMETLQASEIIFRHETVGFGITPTSPAATDLREIATQTGGTYHHAADATQLADVFMEFVNTFSVIDLLGQFGKNPKLPAPPGQADTGGQGPSGANGLTGLLGSFVAPEGGAPTPSAIGYRATGDEDHFLAVATSPSEGTRIAPGESGYYGIGWHTDSQDAAGTTAEAECRRNGGGTACFSNASGKSMRGGCVGLAMAKLRDRGEDPERTYVVTSSSFRHLIAKELRSGCQSTAFGGKYENTVIEHSCEIVEIMCAGGLVPTTPTPAH